MVKSKADIQESCLVDDEEEEEEGEEGEKKSRKRKASTENEVDEDDDEEEEDGEEEEEGKSSSKRTLRSKKATKYSKNVKYELVLPKKTSASKEAAKKKSKKEDTPELRMYKEVEHKIYKIDPATKKQSIEKKVDRVYLPTTIQFTEATEKKTKAVKEKKAKQASGLCFPVEVSEHLFNTLSLGVAQAAGEIITRQLVVKKLWEYIHAKELQNPKDKRQILFDEPLQGIFKKTKANMFEMMKLLSPHILRVGEEGGKHSEEEEEEE
jgi:upstream activation factor subunit UAF30